MDAEVTLFSKPEELIAWADTFDILLNPSIEDAAILLNYMEGHDYAIGIDSDGKMYRQDVAEENGEIEPYPIDDVIDTVCEWNYELILDADAHRNDPKDFKDPESALITSCGASIATLMICTFHSRYGSPIRPIIYEPYSCKSLFSSGVESIFSTMIPIKATLVSIRFLPDYQIYMIFIHESMIQILE